MLHHFNIPLVLATYPQPWQVAADATPAPGVREKFGVGMNTVHLNDRPFHKLEQFAAEHGLPFFNATSAFRQDSRPASLYLSYDFHFTARGNQLYADVLAAYLADHQLTALTASK